METQQIYDQVTERYSAASRGATAEYGQAVAKAFGYSEQELSEIPKESNLGLSCGNPLALASIQEVSYLKTEQFGREWSDRSWLTRLPQGETIIDLGSGAGFDAFLAANNVGPTGKVIGVDMNKVRSVSNSFQEKGHTQF